MRRSKVTLLFSLTFSVDFFMLSPYRPYNKPAFLALIPPCFTSLSPFVTLFRPLQPYSSSHNRGKYENSRFNSAFVSYIENAVTRKQAAHTKSQTFKTSFVGFYSFAAKQGSLRSPIGRLVASLTKSSRLRMSEEHFRTELSKITFYDYIIYPKL